MDFYNRLLKSQGRSKSLMKTYSSQPLAKMSNFLPNLHELITLSMLDIQALKAEIVQWELGCR